MCLNINPKSRVCMYKSNEWWEGGMEYFYSFFK